MTAGLRPGALFTLLAGTFLVALAYGIALPMLPLLLARQPGAAGSIGWHTGLLTGAYTFGLFLFAPLWGRASDRWQRRSVILAGLAGFAAALILFAFFASTTALYLGRFLSGAFAAAIVPVGLALAADCTPDAEQRSRLFGWVGLAGVVGSLVGPALGGVIGAMWQGGMPPLGVPFLLVAAAALLLLAAAWRTLPPVAAASEAGGRAGRGRTSGRRFVLATLLGLAAVVALAVGVLEVGLTLQAVRRFALGPRETGTMVFECMAVMVLAQLLVFNPWFPLRLTRLLLLPALLALAVSLVLLGLAASRPQLFVAVAGVAAAAGLLSPVIGFWVSMAAGRLQGRELGAQTALSSLGQALGSAGAGLMAGTSGRAGAALIVAAVLAVAGAAFAAAIAPDLRAVSVRARSGRSPASGPA